MNTATAASDKRPVPQSGCGAPGASDGRRGVIFMSLSLACFTANTLLLKYLGSTCGVDFSVTMLFRAVIGTVIVLLFFPARRPLRVVPVFTEPKLILRGILGVLGTAAFYWTVPALGAGKATLLGNTYVLFGAVFAAIFLGEHLSRRRTGWLVLAFAGIALLTGVDFSGSSAIGFGEVIALLGAVSAAGVIVLIRQLTETHSNATIFFSQCAWIAIAVTPLAVIRFDWPGWGVIGLLTAAAVAAAYGQLAMVQGFRLLNVTTGASMHMALPVTAALGGYVLFGETFTLLQFAGAALVIAGTWRVILSHK